MPTRSEHRPAQARPPGQSRFPGEAPPEQPASPPVRAHPQARPRPQPQPAPQRKGQGLRIAALAAVTAGVIFLAAAVFVLSYPGIHAVAIQAGVSRSLARIYPLIFDAMLVVAASAVLALRGAGLFSRAYAWLSLLVMMAVAAAADVAHATSIRIIHSDAAAAAAVVPWVLVLLGFGLLIAMLRHARIRRAADTGTALTAADTPLVKRGDARAHDRHEAARPAQPGSASAVGTVPPPATPAHLPPSATAESMPSAPSRTGNPAIEPGSAVPPPRPGPEPAAAPGPAAIPARPPGPERGSHVATSPHALAVDADPDHDDPTADEAIAEVPWTTVRWGGDNSVSTPGAPLAAPTPGELSAAPVIGPAGGRVIDPVAAPELHPVAGRVADPLAGPVIDPAAPPTRSGDIPDRALDRPHSSPTPPAHPD